MACAMLTGEQRFREQAAPCWSPDSWSAEATCRQQVYSLKARVILMPYSGLQVPYRIHRHTLTNQGLAATLVPPGSSQ